MSELSLRMIEMVSKGLEELNDEVAFVGGAVTGIYANDPASDDARPTEDVDCVLQLTSSSGYYELEEKLRKKHFQNDIESSIICRWIYKGITVDVMPDDEKILGFSNRWYAKGLVNKVKYELPNGSHVYVFPVTYYLATKLEAVKSRGGTDLRWSHDFEDFIFVLNGCMDVEDALHQISDEELLAYLKNEFNELVNNPNIEECIDCALPMNEEDRCDYIISLLRTFQ